MFFIISVLIFFIGLICLLFYYEKEVKAALIKELNNHLKAEIKIDPSNIDLTVIKTFPDCSIEFRNMLMLEALAIKNRDTLLYARRLNLHFNIKDLWNKKYEIKKISLRDAVAKPRILKDGKNNYTFWKTNTGGSPNDSLAFNLNYISVDNCRLLFRNRQALFKTELQIKHVAFKGNFKQSEYDLESKGEILILAIAQKKTVFLKDKNLDYKVALDVKKDRFTIKRTDISLNRLALKLEGDFVYGETLRSLNLNYHAPGLEISSLLSLLPSSYTEKINDYESTGNFYAKGSLTMEKNKYTLSSDFGISNGKISYKPTKMEATDVNVEGKLVYSENSSSLDLKNARLVLNTGEVSGSCSIKDFNKPHIALKAIAGIDLEDLQNFWPIDTLTELRGAIKLNADIEGLMTDLKTKTFSSDVKLNLETQVSGLQAKFKGDDKLYTVENCLVTAIERQIEVKNLKLKRGESDVTLNGTIPGLFNHLVDRSAPLVITGTLFSNNLNMDDFIYKSSGSSGKNDKALIPGNVRFKLNSDIRKFTFGKFKASEITGEIEIKNQKAIVSDMKLQTLDGEAEINAFADNSGKKLDVILQGNLRNININHLFAQMNNFGQSTLTNKHLKGIASASIEFSGSWSNDLVPDEKAIQASCNLYVERGELIDFTPLTKLSKFIDVQDLQRIKFSTLQSHIQIRDKIITIPRTTIKNSALNIEVWGTHAFDNKIDYHIQLLISELLAKKRKKKDDEFGPLEHDPENRRSAYVLMTGTVEDPIIKYDKKGLKEKIKRDIKQEGQNFRQILKEEFGVFKKDSVSKPNKSEHYFELEKPEEQKPKKTLELKKKEDDEDF